MILLLSGMPAMAQDAQQPANPITDLQKSFAEISKELDAQLGPLAEEPVQGQSVQGLPVQEQMAQEQVGQEPDNNIPSMFNDYITVLAFLKPANEEAKQNAARVRVLCTDYMAVCRFVGEFWRVKALRECVELNAYAVDRLLPQNPDPAQEEYVTGMLAHCAKGYYYDHWDELNKSIKIALDNAQKAGLSKGKQ